jgi:HPt (histidine-containing phosphotransfer) domain-containing protein
LTGLPCREAFPTTLFDRFETLKILTTQTRQSVEDIQTLQLPGASGSGCLFLAPLVNRTARIIGYLGLFRPAAPAMTPPSVPVEKIPETLPSPSPPVVPTPQASVLDIEDGLNRLGGNAAIYAKILRVFYTENQKTPDRVLAALNAGDRETLHRLVHTVKGASGNIGARELFAIAAQTEETIRSANSAVEEPIQVFLKSLARLLETLADVEKLSLK